MTENAIIDLKGIGKTFDGPAGAIHALRTVDLQVYPGEFVGVRGPSGSGKSTLINMITGIDRTSRGDVHVSGALLNKLNENQLARWRGKNVGVIFQFFQLLPTLTVIENIMLPMDFCRVWKPRHRPERALNLLEQVGLADQAYKLPNTLSGGQQQRAAIARALSNDPPLVMGDEPTGNLDSKSADRVFYLFEDLVKQGKTFMMVTHDVGLANRIPRVVEVLDGALFENGNGSGGVNPLMKTAFRKVWRDLWRNKGRTIMVILSIAVGVMAVGMVVSGNQLVLGQMANSHIQSNPAHGMLFLSGIVGEDTIRSLKRVSGVLDIEGYSESDVHWKTALDGEWQDGRIISYSDFENQKYDQLTLKTGGWPTDNTVGVEAAHIDSYNAPGYGGTVYFEINERARSMTVNGMMRNPFEFPAPFGQNSAFYVSPQTFQRIAHFNGSNILRFTIVDYSEEQVYQVGDDINEKLNKIGVSVWFAEVLHPEEHYLQEMINGVGMVLTVMAIGSLGLSVMLVINTINALIAQQIPQIGIMKAIGGLGRQIATLYLSSILVYGLLSLLIAVPTGAYAGNRLAQWMLNLLNVPMTPFEILPGVLILQISVGLLTPLLAGLYPVLQGVAIPAAEAISQTGLGRGHYGRRFIDRLMGKIHGLPRMAVLSLRNTFRRPGRVILTLLTLTISGAFFIMVFSTQWSFVQTLDKTFAGFGYEVQINFEKYQRIDEIIPMIESRPNVKNAEMWTFRTADTRVPGASGPGSEYEVFMRGVPSESPLFSPELTAGRMLEPEDNQAILLNQKLAGKMGVGVGDEIIIDLPDAGDTRWTVVGLVFDLNGRDQNTAFANIDVFNRALHNVGRSAVAMIQGIDQSLTTQKAIETDLKNFFKAEGIGISYSAVAVEDRQNASAQFGILTQILMVMTVLMAIVGSMGLSGTLSINVIERRREIGVMRAVGASSRDVGFIFTGEGLMLGLASWALALPIGLLTGPLFVKTLGGVIDFPAEYYLAYQGIWIWLGIVVVLSILASWIPARRATQISVNESLAYE